MFQTPGRKHVDCNDHVWLEVRRGRFRWKCCVCGAATSAAFPPDSPTPEHWMPERYEPLTEEDRAQCP